MERFVLILFPALISTSGASKSVYAQVGGRVVLKPPAINTYKYVYWRFAKEDGLQLAWRNHLGGTGINKDEPWTNKLTLPDESLVITNLQPENFGTYFCEITSGSQTLPIHSIELIKLNVSVSPAEPLLPGESLSLSCTADYRKKPEIYWLNPRGERIKNNQGTVTVRVTSQDDGMWICVVAEEKQVKMPVKVVGLSPAPLVPHYTSTSSPITVPCSIPPLITWEQIKAKGIHEVHWQFFPETSSGLISQDAQRLFSLSLAGPLSWKRDQPRGLSPARDPKTGNLDLTRKLARVEDRGDYMCTMKFKNGRTLNRTVHVEVLQIISSPGPHLLSGQQLNLTCSVGQPLPSDLHLQWFRPKQSAQPDLKSARLTIPEVSTDDGGQWECGLLQGETRLTSAAITLTIEPKLSVWMLVISCSAAAIVSLLLLILGLIIHRRRRRKMRHLRPQLCRCKKPKPKGFYRT
ncbi:CD4-2 molecule, tandem duplicate 2 [Hippoglossus hippoglossus]|uniref:T-cell surface glycoprotein n=2 Tax=Hippoglossus hippoglossus TaxID=8267 RepID=B9UYP4_HIPHI|nr:CD4-2 molecule, tandem duplicate 2 [Hippoglossus hippoglossus]ACM50925.1 T-cell surface glycoprotein [Hippoglossus hippoglossus]